MGGQLSLVAADKISDQLGGSAARRQEKTDQLDAVASLSMLIATPIN